MRRKEERSKQGQTNKQTNKAKQHSTPKVVTCTELPSRNLEQAGDLPIGHSQKWECPQLTKFIAKLCALVGVATLDGTLQLRIA